ncbi:MAG: AIR synthase related protein [Candidatus Altiarchaeota archaeon]|nr:AIR synthase related protein [Candidatus Altiarchaeota archaeon]
MKKDIDRCIGHMLETNDIRRVFWYMDDKVEHLRYGIRQGDDAVIVGDTVINMEGPYPLKIGRKTGLIHTCSDIVVMGAKPLYALNSMQVDSVKAGGEIAKDLKKQSDGLGVPIIGGNTQLENNLESCISFAVYGSLVNKPVADSGVAEGDKILMLGEVVEGDIGQRVQRAKVKFKTFLELLENDIEINAAKDASRGGWFGNLVEMLVKSRMGFNVRSIPFPHITRYMGNYLISVPKAEVSRVLEVSARNKCPLVEVGEAVKELAVSIGGEVVVEKEKMMDLIKGMPYKKPSK